MDRFELADWLADWLGKHGEVSEEDAKVMFEIVSRLRQWKVR